MGAVIAVCAICVQGATKIWTGSGADAKFSTDGNWEDMAAPVNGDTLVFQGENAVAENDFDSTVQFAAIYMSNSVPFTIRGNTLYLSGSRIFAKTLSTTITDRFEADVVFRRCLSRGGERQPAPSLLRNGRKRQGDTADCHSNRKHLHL